MSRVRPVHAPLLRLALCLSAGIALGDFFVPPLQVLLAALVLTLLLALLAGRSAGWQSAAICLCFALLGATLCVRQRQQLDVGWPDREWAFQAVIVSEPTEKPKTMAMDVVLAEGGQRLRCYLPKDDRSRHVGVGDGLLLQARVEAPREWRIGTFDYRRYLQVQGVTGIAFVRPGHWVQRRVSLARLSRPQRLRLRFLVWRRQLLQRFRQLDFTGREYGIVAAMTLGDKSALPKELKETYSISGASHVLALSGLHLGIIYSLLSLLVAGRRLRLVSQILVVLGIWAFALLAGLPASAVRAAIMFSVCGLLALGHRDSLTVGVLSLTAIVMLCLSPNALFDVGFQLSFAAMFSILLFYPLFYGLLSPVSLQRHRLLRWGWGMVCVSVAAQLGSAPLVAYYFGRFPTLFLLTNFIVIPAATLILWLAVPTLLLPAGGLLPRLLATVIGWLNSSLSWLSALPFASIEGLHPTPLQMAMLYVILLAAYALLLKVLQNKKRPDMH